MKITTLTLATIGALVVGGFAGDAVEKFPSVIITATAQGAVALDRDSEGGNPFATALIETMPKQPKEFSEFFKMLTTTTRKQSREFQSPDWFRTNKEPPIPFSAEFASQSRLALVMVYTDYSGSDMRSLPGAEHDSKRIRRAFMKQGFECWSLVDPPLSQVEATLKAFQTVSSEYDYSVIYVTGHGVEVGEIIYLLPPTFRVSEGKDSLRTKGLVVRDFQNYQRSKRGNVLFYGGCRNDPFSRQE